MKILLTNVLFIFSLHAEHAYNCSGINNYAARTALNFEKRHIYEI
jgi:hypothetical protein